jgi:hypothetical protein
MKREINIYDCIYYCYHFILELYVHMTVVALLEVDSPLIYQATKHAAAHSKWS